MLTAYTSNCLSARWVRDGNCFAWTPGLSNFAIILWCYSYQTNKLLRPVLNVGLPLWKAGISLCMVVFCCFLVLLSFIYNTAASFIFTCSPSSEINAHAGCLAFFFCFTYLSLPAFLHNVPDAPFASYRTSVLLTSDILYIWQLIKVNVVSLRQPGRFFYLGTELFFFCKVAPLKK